MIETTLEFRRFNPPQISCQRSGDKLMIRRVSKYASYCVIYNTVAVTRGMEVSDPIAAYTPVFT